MNRFESNSKENNNTSSDEEEEDEEAKVCIFIKIFKLNLLIIIYSTMSMIGLSRN